MTRFLILLAPTLISCLMASQDRPYFNEIKAPETQNDVQSIQSALQSVLPKARAATVCIELKEGSGSGVIVSPEGLVLTAAHVSTRVNKKVTVIMEDGTRHPAITLGLVANSDAAMIQITDEGSFPFVEVDRSESLRLGDWIFSLGHSGGFDQARGSVVRLGRLIRIANETVQSDCILIGGDSGGPLFDLSGKLVGIHSRVGQQLQVNMHVPMRVFIDHWADMLDSKFIGEGPYATLPEKGQGFIGILTEPHPKGGLRITKIGKNTPAQSAGLKVGDRLLKLNSNALDNRPSMQALLKEMAPTDEVTFEYERDGKTQTLTFELGER